MKACVLVSDLSSASSPVAKANLHYDPFPYLDHLDDWAVATLTKATAVQTVNRLCAQGYDVFLQLCDGGWDEDQPGPEVIQALERNNVAFSGTTFATYEPPRHLQRLAAISAGVNVPDFVDVTEVTLPIIGEITARLRFPMIVKHGHSYSSIGMTADSKVYSPGALHTQLKRMVDQYGTATVEEFIEGREFTVLVVEGEYEPICFPPMEVVFNPGETFKHFDLKMQATLPMKRVDDFGLSQELSRIASLMMTEMQIVGYSRSDIRMDSDGKLYLLEINTNPSVFNKSDEASCADNILSLVPNGHQMFMDMILTAAQRRVKRPAAERRLVPGRGYGMFATRDIARGEVVIPFEGQPQNLMSKAHVQANYSRWSDYQRKLFARYAWPFTEGIYVVSSLNPVDWQPINHSCDPNIWYTGLDLTARRAITAGEELTMEYATFADEMTERFECHCGATNCRGVVSGTDHLEPFVASIYAGHVTEYVKAKRVRLGLDDA